MRNNHHRHGASLVPPTAHLGVGQLASLVRKTAPTSAPTITSNAQTPTPSTASTQGVSLAAPAAASTSSSTLSAPVATLALAVGAPAAPTVLAASPDGVVSGTLSTYSDQLTLTGTAAAGATVTVYDGSTQLGTATADASGAWSFTTAASLADGVHSLAATAAIGTGPQSALSSALAVTVLPGVANFNPLTDQWSKPISVGGANYYVENANVNGNAPWAITEINDHTLRFTLKPNDLWADNGSNRTEISGGTTYAANATINASYQFTVQPGTADPGLDWEIIGQFHADDNAPLVAKLTADYPIFSVHLTGAGGSGGGDYLAIEGIYLPANSLTPIDVTSANNGYLYVSSQPITRGQPYNIQIEASFQDNSSGFLEVWLNGKQIVDYHGPIGYGTGANAVGTYWKEGIYSGYTPTQTVTVDFANTSVTATPGAPVIASDAVNAGKVTLTGTGEANATLTLYSGSTSLGTAKVDSTGHWTFTTAALAAGAYSFTAKVTDTAGNVSSASNAMTATVGTVTLPSAPVIASDVVNGDLATLSGTALANGTVTVYSGSTSLGTATADASGNWTFTSGPLKAGTYALTATVADAAGNVSAASASASATILPPSAPVILSDPVNGDLVTLSGTALANGTVTVYSGSQTLGTTVADSNGDWTFTTAPLGSGAYAFTATVTDAAGNVSALSNALDPTVGPGSSPPAPAPSQDLTIAEFLATQSTLDAQAASITIADTAANISAALDHLADPNLVGLTVLDNAGIAVSVHQLLADAPAIDLLTDADGSPYSLSVTDTAANVQAGLGALEADSAHISAIHLLAGGAPILNLSATQATADCDALSKIAGPWVLNETTASGATITTGHGSGLTINDVAGNDTITGGGAHETFGFSAGFHLATLVDFYAYAGGSNHDVINLPKTDFSSFYGLLHHASQSGANVVLTAANGDKLTLDNMTLSALRADKADFRFV